MGVKGAEADGGVSGKVAGPNPGEPVKLAVLSGREGWGVCGVAVKCIDITQNSDCGGSMPAPD